MPYRNEFGTCTVTYADVDGLLVACATNANNYSYWTAGRSYDGIGAAVRAALELDWTPGPYEGSDKSEGAAIREFKARENHERMLRNENEGLCHCGHPFYGSDHCPLCGCEQYESYCDTHYHDSAHGRVTCDCPHHSDIESTDDPRAWSRND